MKTLLCWSSGKDSAWALGVLRESSEFDVVGLVTTLNETHDRVAMHAVRRELLEQQADAVGLHLEIVPIPYPCPNETYEAAMARVVESASAAGVEAMAFGDLFLEDVRDYRVKQLRGTGLTPLFPLWGMPTAALAREMVTSGLEARITCVDPRALPASFAGRRFDGELLDDLPETVDPCGENGEFHTFCHDGPMFRRPVEVQPGEVVARDDFVFADLLPARLGGRQ